MAREKRRDGFKHRFGGVFDYVTDKTATKLYVANIYRLCLLAAQYPQCVN
jgi:hypothetical protein